MGDNRRFYLKIVKATLITIVMMGYHGRGTMDMLRGTLDMSMISAVKVLVQPGINC